MSQTPFQIIRIPKPSPVGAEPPVDSSTGHTRAESVPSSATREPAGYVVVREEGGTLSGPVIFADLTQANTAQGIAAGYSPPGVEWNVYALTDITERPTE